MRHIRSYLTGFVAHGAGLLRPPQMVFGARRKPALVVATQAGLAAFKGMRHVHRGLHERGCRLIPTDGLVADGTVGTKVRRGGRLVAVTTLLTYGLPILMADGAVGRGVLTHQRYGMLEGLRHGCQPKPLRCVALIAGITEVRFRRRLVTGGTVSRCRLAIHMTLSAVSLTVLAQ
jgi:hypothetical protein